MKGRFLAIGFSAFLSISSVILFSRRASTTASTHRGIQVEAVSKERSVCRRCVKASRSSISARWRSRTSAAANRCWIRVQRQPGGEQAQTVALNKVKDAVTTAIPVASMERTEVVGPTVSANWRAPASSPWPWPWWRSCSTSVPLRMHFAVGAIAVLLLDITKTVGFFALTGHRLQPDPIAALLTMIGYSVNDKVVVYDRMRENLRKYKSMPFSDLIDMSINQVIARCIFTSAATALFPGADGDLGRRGGAEPSHGR